MSRFPCTGQDYLNLVYNSNARLATYQEVQQLFANLAAQSLTMQIYDFLSTFNNISAAYYNQKNGQFGLADEIMNSPDWNWPAAFVNPCNVFVACVRE